ncbi:rhombotin-1 [Caerostris darwini]|uniref:Rhombotin-1 n=1 Tax=Caerostris darwini TaxID=1538125 RepID=A0AAV4W0Z6_9ARAC|nr:rhombotin-1 [Caerostris darwini]
MVATETRAVFDSGHDSCNQRHSGGLCCLPKAHPREVPAEGPGPVLARGLPECACCDCRLGEVGSTLFTKANLILCKRDYLRLFGTTGLCSACNKTIPAFEMVMRARGNVYHLECFACQQCFHRFCVGDRFYLFENKVLCELDYEERVLIASLPYPTYNSLDQIQRQTDSLIPLSPAVDDASSGYGSPSSLISDGH